MQKNTKITVQILLGATVIASFAQITYTINLSNLSIPVTGQSLAVVLIASFLGAQNGTVAVLIYLLLGLLGLPVFAGASGGLEVLKSGSMGFLFGFLPTAYCSGYLESKNKNNNFFRRFLGLLFVTALLFFCGVAWLAMKYDVQTALKYGFFPLVGGAIIKLFLASSIIFVTKKYYFK